MTAIENVCRALQNPEVVDFERATLLSGYSPYFPTMIAQVHDLIERALARLVASQRQGLDRAGLIAATEGVIREVYCKSDPTFWFNEAYHRYKTEVKPRTDLEQLRSLIRGKRVLDYGCGSGYLSARLHQAGYQVSTTDVLDYRYPEARHLPFVQMHTPTEILFPAESIDTTLIQAVLHHIDESDLRQILPRLARISRYLLIKEDSYGLPAASPGLSEICAAQPLLARFLALPLTTQFEILVLIDFFANAVAQGIPEMHMPFEFRTPVQWQALLAANGFTVEQVIVAGFEPGRMHQSCHIWLACERSA